MSTAPLERIIPEILERFAAKNAAREQALAAARVIIRTSANAIRAVHRGEIYIYPSFTRVLLGDLLQDMEPERYAAQDAYDALSQREKQVLRLVALGHTNRQIADQLFLSVKTVEAYRARLMQKLHLKNRSALVRYALRKGLLLDNQNYQPVDHAA